MLETAETSVDVAWLLKKTNARDYVDAVFEPEGRVPQALRARLARVAEHIDQGLRAGDELWAWRKPDKTVGGLAVVRARTVVLAWTLKA